MLVWCALAGPEGIFLQDSCLLGIGGICLNPVALEANSIPMGVRDSCVLTISITKGSHSSISKHPKGARPSVQQVVREPARGTRRVVRYRVELKSWLGQLQRGTST